MDNRARQAMPTVITCLTVTMRWKESVISTVNIEKVIKSEEEHMKSNSGKICKDSLDKET